MMAMQYSFTLPADYDMAIIDRRIATNGALLDGFPGLGFKAYLSARKGDLGSRENLYAPFYLWERAEGISNFLCGPGFAGLSADFGRPPVNTFVVWHGAAGEGLGGASYASRETLPVTPFADLARLCRDESSASAEAIAGGGALASVAGFDPTRWTVVRFRLWPEAPPTTPDTQIYRVGHMSLSGRFAR